VTFPPSAVHSSAPDVEPSAGDATIPSAQTGVRSHRRCTRRSSHAGGRLVAGARGSDGAAVFESTIADAPGPRKAAAVLPKCFQTP
jgi:hypothetical protein